jgi:N-acetylglucosamine kinase-like BadF-type ATPase
MPKILSIDQGGTKTDIVIADEKGNILGYGNDRDMTPVEGERRAVRMIRIRHAADKAAEEAALTYAEIDSVSAGCIGADWEFEYEVGRRNIRKALGIQDVTLYNDCIGALRGGTEMLGRDCAILCLGTGANCAVFNRDGEMHTYHYYMKDIHQGAGAIGNFIFQAVLDAQSGLGKETALTRILLQETGYSSVDELHMMLTTGRSEEEKPWYYPVFQDYCPLLFRAIDEGDKISTDYLDWLCGELVEYIVIGVNRLSIGERSLDVVLSGGVPKGGNIMGERLSYHLNKRLPNARFVEARLEPVVGALLLGYDKLYPNGVPEDVMQTLEKCCRERGLFRK